MKRKHHKESPWDFPYGLVLIVHWCLRMIIIVAKRTHCTQLAGRGARPLLIYPWVKCCIIVLRSITLSSPPILKKITVSPPLERFLNESLSIIHCFIQDLRKPLYKHVAVCMVIENNERYSMYVDIGECSEGAETRGWCVPWWWDWYELAGSHTRQLSIQPSCARGK